MKPRFEASRRTLHQAAARALSILGHPALLMPGSVLGKALHQGASSQFVQLAAAASVAVAVAVLVYSGLRVRAGQWEHADASRPAERVQLNRFLLGALLVAAALSLAHGEARAITAGALLCAALVAVALLLRPWLKLSLHIAFAAFAAWLWWPALLAMLALGALACAVAWSRLALGRHTLAEVLFGAVAGSAAGIAWHGPALLLP